MTEGADAASDGSIMVLNAGSSSLKFSLYQVDAGRDEPLATDLQGKIEKAGRHTLLRVHDAAGRTLQDREIATPEDRWIEEVLGAVEARAHAKLQAIGHRVVHGGLLFNQPVLATKKVFEKLEKLTPLAPLHQPMNLAAMRAAHRWRPKLPQVACFDTAFHRTHPQRADLYALPWKFHQRGVRRYGFHGLSYEYIASVLPQVAPELAAGRVIVAHMGNGVSVCALQAGRSMDCSMGFSVLDGVPMGTRAGSLDPGIFLYLLREQGCTGKELETLLYHQSGLLGLSAVSSDMRRLLASDKPHAALAVDYFVHHVAREIAGLATSIGGLDGVVFTGGIGENSAEIRARIAEACAWLGVKLDSEANGRGEPQISAPDSRVSAWVVKTNEELMMARHVLKFLQSNEPVRSKRKPSKEALHPN